MFPNDNSVELSPHERVAVVALRHEIDLQDAHTVTEVFHRARSHSETDATLLDLSMLTFADSTLLGLILQARIDHEQEQRPFVLAGPLHSAVQRLLELTGVTGFLPLADTREEGMRKLRALLDAGAGAELPPSPPGRQTATDPASDPSPPSASASAS
ncbi:STAS domain-containing protein [Streptomyces sp. NBC_01283]|uniref:STAS domain-containing protein n=1 Tax=Streptomyces sp. NBC_01283 TaxID=2903812 RepID=UPI00352E5D87|nr:STAS domain-containing protein [Streptomyces sp. NBC_01283]